MRSAECGIEVQGRSYREVSHETCLVCCARRSRVGRSAASSAVSLIPPTQPGRHLGYRRRGGAVQLPASLLREDRKSTRLNSSHTVISYAVFCLKKKKTTQQQDFGRKHIDAFRRTGHDTHVAARHGSAHIAARR